MDKDTIIRKTRLLKDRIDLINLLNEIKTDSLKDNIYPFNYRQLQIFCNPSNEGRYQSFEIPKKSGGVRLISSPRGNLKWFQLCLNEIFKALYSPSPYAMGFTVGKSIVDNARMHTNQNYVFNIDLENFFSSIDQARVWKRLQLPPFNFNANVAKVIAGLCSIKVVCESDSSEREVRFVLPQGAPTSPLLTNAVCDTLDRRLHGLAKRFGLHYSRYADDITFSSMHNVYQEDSEFRKELQRIIIQQHFIINKKKTRLNHCSARQEVTGLTVNSRVNVTRKYIKDLRAILHIWEKYGLNAAFATFFPHYRSEKCQLHRGEPNLVNIILGKLYYLKMVKGETDRVYTKLNTQYNRLIKNFTKYERQNNIDYLLTMSKSTFEKKLGITMKFATRKSDQRSYGWFLFNDRHFIVAVSKNIDINKIPDNAQISFTRMLMNNDNKLEHKDSEFKLGTRIGYLLHKPVGSYLSGACQNKTKSVSTDLKNFIINFANSYPELGLNDDKGIIETHNRENLLARLVETDFDLSILT